MNLRAISILFVMASCKSREAPLPIAASPSTASSAPAVAAAASVPADFPAAGSAKIAGNLAGKRFTVAKAALRVTPNGATLDLYAWSEGGACAPQFAPGPDQLYVSMAFPSASAQAHATIRSADVGVVVTYKRPTFDPIATQATLVIDDFSTTRATGRVLLTAPDGTRISGAFDAAVCASEQHAPSSTPTLQGLMWGTEGVEPSAISSNAVSTWLLGATTAPLAVEAIEWQDASLGQHEIHFFTTKPAQACAFDQMSPGFKIGFPGDIKSGSTIKTKVTTVTGAGHAFAVALWNEPGGVLGMEGNGWVSAVIDAATPGELRGRVFAWFSDASKSMIAGAFTAKRCHVRP